MTEEQWAEWARQMAGMQEIDPVEDPDAIEADPADTLGIEDVDSAAVEPPEVAPPVVDSINPPVVAPPVVIPPQPPPPPPVPIDSIGNI